MKTDRAISLKNLFSLNICHYMYINSIIQIFIFVIGILERTNQVDHNLQQVLIKHMMVTPHINVIAANMKVNHLIHHRPHLLHKTTLTVSKNLFNFTLGYINQE